MKAHILLLFIFSTITTAFAQTDIETRYQKAYSLMKSNNISKAFQEYKALKSIVSDSDTLYNYITWYYASTGTQIESGFRMAEKFDSSLAYGLEILNLIRKNKDRFDERFSEKEPWMIKNIIVSYFGLGKIEEANQYKTILYNLYREKSLPKGMNGNFNFDFFTLDNKNIWGYEWFPELPDDRFSTSFTKIVYYVYSRNADGTDKDQLCRYHVLMFHQDPTDAKFDYVLERQQELDSVKLSGTYYKYTYKKDIDYKKLKEDIKYIITNKTEPDTRRTVSIPKRN